MTKRNEGNIHNNECHAKLNEVIYLDIKTVIILIICCCTHGFA